MLLPGWSESTLNGFVITVSWWRSISLNFNIVIIDILMILYVMVFTKMGNMPFKYFSRLWYMFKVIDTIMIYIWILTSTYKQRNANSDLVVWIWHEVDILQIMVLNLCFEKYDYNDDDLGAPSIDFG